MATRETPAHCPAPRNETRSVLFSPVTNRGCTIASTNTLRRHKSSNRTHLSRTHSSMGSRCLIVEDLQNGREFEGSMRFATRNRKNRVNIGLSALRGDSCEQAKSVLHEQSIESI